MRVNSAADDHPSLQCLSSAQNELTSQPAWSMWMDLHFHTAVGVMRPSLHLLAEQHNRNERSNFAPLCHDTWATVNLPWLDNCL
jgi:hypothetical protein